MDLRPPKDKHLSNVSQGETLRGSESILLAGAEPTCVTGPLLSSMGCKEALAISMPQVPFPCAELWTGFPTWQLIFSENTGLGHTHPDRFVLKSKLE